MALPFTLQPQPKSLLPSRTPLTDFCNRKPKLEHAHERSSPRLHRAFHTKELRSESARAARAGYPAGHTPVARACLRTDRSAAEPARCKAPEPTRPLNQTPLSLTRDSSHWRAMNWFQSLPRFGSSPPRERTNFRTNPGAFGCKGTRRVFWTRRDQRDELPSITTALFIASRFGSAVDGPTPYPQAAVARAMLVSKRADRCRCSALTTSARLAFASRCEIGRAHV